MTLLFPAISPYRHFAFIIHYVKYDRFKTHHAQRLLNYYQFFQYTYNMTFTSHFIHLVSQ